MFVLILILTSFITRSFSITPSNLTAPRIVGGEPCDPTDYPFLVVIYSDVLCGDGGSTTIKPVMGTNSEEIQVRFANKAVVHHKFDKNLMSGTASEVRYDIALLQTDRPFMKTEHLGFVHLPQPNFTDHCQEGTAVGVGSTFVRGVFEKSYNGMPLKCVDLSIIDEETCSEMWPKSVIDDSVVCTMDKEGGKDACEGDSGGPLLCDNVIIGVISSGRGCGVDQKAATYTKVEKYLDFILTSMEKEGVDNLGGRTISFTWRILCATLWLHLIIRL